MSELLSQEGIILRKIPYSEADEIITVLLKHDGVRRLFVGGSRKSKKRYAGLIDLFADLKFEYRMQAHSLWRLQKIEEIERDSKAGTARFWERDLQAYAFISYLAELICEFTPEEIQAGDLFEFWQQVNAKLERNAFNVSFGVAQLLKLFASFGYGWILDRCVSCSTTALTEHVFFVPDRGGILCQACADLHRIPPLYHTSLSFVQKLAASDESQSWSPLESKIAFQVFKNILSYSHVILQKRTRAEAFLLQMLGEVE